MLTLIMGADIASIASFMVCYYSKLKQLQEHLMVSNAVVFGEKRMELTAQQPFGVSHQCLTKLLLPHLVYPDTVYFSKMPACFFCFFVFLQSNDTMFSPVGCDG